MKPLTKLKKNWLIVKPHLDSKRDVQKRFALALFASLFIDFFILTLVFGAAYYFLGHVTTLSVLGSLIMQVIIFLCIVYSAISSSLEVTVLYIEKKK